jgi:hypothetical protein
MPASVAPHSFHVEPGDVTSQECQQKAAECLRLVRITADSTNKALLLEMAQAWIKLAEKQTYGEEPRYRKPAKQDRAVFNCASTETRRCNMPST